MAVQNDWKRLIETDLADIKKKVALVPVAIWASYGAGIFTGIFAKQIIALLFHP